MDHAHQLIGGIENRTDLVRFLSAFRQDLELRSEQWENPTLDRFLEALEAWVAGMDRWAANQEVDIDGIPRWQLFAHMLQAASVYE